MHGNSPEADRHFDAHTRADARFASTMICQVIGTIRSGLPLDVESLAMSAEGLMHTCYSSNEADLNESLSERAQMLRNLMRDMRQDPHNGPGGA